MSVTKTAYGQTPDGRTIDLYTLTNSHGLRARVLTFGAVLAGLEAPDRDGRLADVALGFDTPEDWMRNPGCFGATVGRFANRIAKGKFTLDGATYTLATNNGENHLHGGRVGFHKVLWGGEPVRRNGAVGVKLAYQSRDGEEGYPGNLAAAVTYTLTDADELAIDFDASTDKPTVVNLAHHTYWNLAGQGVGDVLGHVLTIHADRFLPTDAGKIPTGELRAVKGGPMDFTAPTPVGSRIARVEGGYDHCYVLRGQAGAMRLAATVYDPATGRAMDLYTDQPGVQLYTANGLSGKVKGKGGVAYPKHAGLCLETQYFPDAPNHANFPSAVLRPGQTYRHRMVHRFYVK